MRLVKVILWTVLFTGYFMTANCVCPNGCDCAGNIMTCARPDFPRNVPDNITKVFMKDFNFLNLKPGIFSTGNWKKLKFLDIHSGGGDVLANYSFEGLNQLEHLGIHGDMLMRVGQHALDSLDMVQALDLSRNIYLSVADIIPAIDATTRPVLGSLRNLSFSRLLFTRGQVNLIDNSVTKALSFNRSLRYLDISYTNMVFEFNTFYSLCETLEHLKAQHMGLLFPMGSQTALPCKSLHTFDLSDTILPLQIGQMPYDNIAIECSTFLDNVENFIFSGISDTVVDLSYSSVSIQDCNYHFRNFLMKRNGFKKLNFTLIINEGLRDSLTNLDVSENLLEFLSPEILYPAFNLQVLNLSSNKLSIMQTQYTGKFARLLQKSVGLQEVYLSNNMFTNIPAQFFANNTQLDIIDLSRNLLTSFTVEIQSLKKLKFLDLSNNAFKTIQDSILIMFDSFNDLKYYGDQGDETSSTTNQPKRDDPGLKVIDTNITQFPQSSSIFQVKLSSNPFECNCNRENIHFLYWLMSSITVYRTESPYTCVFQDETLDILASAALTVEKQCKYQQLLNKLKSGIPVMMGCLLIGIISALILRYKSLKKKRQRDVLELLEHDRYPKQFLVYLSYCSEDTDFALTKIYTSLQNTLTEKTKNRRNFVCIGDRNFHLGRHVSEEVARCMKNSAVVIFVVSNMFCKKGWCQVEVDEAYAQRKPIIMLMKEHVDAADMPDFLRTIFNRYTHASWVNDESGGHLEPDMEILVTSIIELASNQDSRDFICCPKPVCFNLCRGPSTEYTRLAS